MALNIKNEAVVSLARQVAERTGESLTDAVHVALLERFQRIVKEHERATKRARIDELLEEFGPLGRYADGMTIEDLYDDETGLPK